MRKPMTRTQAWWKVAEAFDTPPSNRTEKQREIADHGLCWGLAVCELGPNWYCGVVQEHPTYATMISLKLAFGIGTAWWWPCKAPEWDAERATFAGLMAAMTQEERDYLVADLGAPKGAL